MVKQTTVHHSVQKAPAPKNKIGHGVKHSTKGSVPMRGNINKPMDHGMGKKKVTQFSKS